MARGLFEYLDPIMAASMRWNGVIVNMAKAKKVSKAAPKKTPPLLINLLRDISQMVSNDRCELIVKELAKTFSTTHKVLDRVRKK